jgi:hypothetical protein
MPLSQCQILGIKLLLLFICLVLRGDLTTLEFLDCPICTGLMPTAVICIIDIAVGVEDAVLPPLATLLILRNCISTVAFVVEEQHNRYDKFCKKEEHA